jgi:hypothetical protein
MVNYSLSGVAGIRAYLWDLLQDQLSWGEINGVVPIVSPQQQPELTNGTAPFIVYNWSMAQQYAPQILCEQAAFMVYGDEGQVNTAVNLIADHLRRWDWSARDVNDYIATLADGDLKKLFDYKTIYVTAASGPDPAEQEGGRVEGMVMIKYDYTIAVDSEADPLAGGAGLRGDAWIAPPPP